MSSTVTIASEIIEFALSADSKKLSVDRRHIAAIEELTKGTKIYIGSGANFVVAENYETVAARVIHTDLSGKSATRELVAARNATTAPQPA